MSELNVAIDKLERITLAHIGMMEALESMLKQFSNAAKSDTTTTETQPQEEPPKPQPKALTLEEVRAVLVEKSRSGHTDAVREILGKYGVSKLSDVDPQNYAAILADAETLQ